MIKVLDYYLMIEKINHYRTELIQSKLLFVSFAYFVLWINKNGRYQSFKLPNINPFGGGLGLKAAQTFMKKDAINIDSISYLLKEVRNNVFETGERGDNRFSRAAKWKMSFISSLTRLIFLFHISACSPAKMILQYWARERKRDSERFRGREDDPPVPWRKGQRQLVGASERVWYAIHWARARLNPIALHNITFICFRTSLLLTIHTFPFRLSTFAETSLTN